MHLCSTSGVTWVESCTFGAARGGDIVHSSHVILHFLQQQFKIRIVSSIELVIKVLIDISSDWRLPRLRSARVFLSRACQFPDKGIKNEALKHSWKRSTRQGSYGLLSGLSQQGPITPLKSWTDHASDFVIR